MTVWIDGDACPRAIKDIIFNSCIKRQVPCVFVSNSHQRLPKSPWILQQIVASGLDVADNYIAAQVQKGDLVITQDIPLAYEIVRKDVQAVSPRGLEFTSANVADKLSTRDLKDELRGFGVATGGPPPIGEKEKQKFAGVLDRYITQWLKKSNERTLI